MADLVLQTVPLGQQWPTIDPFLFCVHHDDAYPAGNEQLGPAASLAGRDIGQDFSARDGWSMYHGHVAPGFPQHPHRGFETVTFARRGYIDHSDSLGATARFGRGDVQWMTAGKGIVHAEMFPLLDLEAPNPVELFQIWLNLPAVDKLVEPHFAMLWDQRIPRLVIDGDGRQAAITVVAGRLDGRVPPPPPPSSWASRPDSDVAIWHVHLEPGASWTMPAAEGAETARVLYVFAGREVRIGGTAVGSPTGVVVDAQQHALLQATDEPGDEAVEILVLQGRPIGEPVAQYGPFVMNTRAEIQQAFEDYQATGFGGWPWPSDDPNHGRDANRFARHANGDLDTPPEG